MTTPLRVAQVMGYMNGGGVESVVMNYYRHIDRTKVQFDFIVCERSEHVPAEEIESLGGRLFLVPQYKALPNFINRLIDLFRTEGWHIVHSHLNTLSVFPLFAAKRAGVPVRIAHSHSSLGGGEGEGARDVIKSVLRRFSNIYPTHRFACGDLAGSWLFRGAPFEIVPNAIDLVSFRSDSDVRNKVRSELGIADDTFVVGHIGRMVPVKNHRRLLSIFSVLSGLCPNSVLVLVGDGELSDEVREEAEELGLQDKVLFLGMRPDAARLYQAFDVFCLPSAYEGFPVVSVESQASGTPILASSAVSRETAITSLMQFESLESPDLTWARHLLAMKDAALTEADAKALLSYDIDTSARKLEEAYASLCEAIPAVGDDAE